MGTQRGGEGSKQGLLDTIQGLQRALERSRKECQAAISSAKYMQVTVYILHTHTLLFSSSSLPPSAVQSLVLTTA